MAQGTVKWFSSEKGYRFITREEDGKDFFIHFSGIQANGFRSLEDNDRVEFTVGSGLKGPQATHVRRI